MKYYSSQLQIFVTSPELSLLGTFAICNPGLPCFCWYHFVEGPSSHTGALFRQILLLLLSFASVFLTINLHVHLYFLNKLHTFFPNGQFIEQIAHFCNQQIFFEYSYCTKSAKWSQNVRTLTRYRRCCGHKTALATRPWYLTGRWSPSLPAGD